MDASPDYFYAKDVPARMVQVYPPSLRPSVRLISVLREPVARMVSAFNYYSEPRPGEAPPNATAFFTEKLVKDPGWTAHVHYKGEIVQSHFPNDAGDLGRFADAFSARQLLVLQMRQLMDPRQYAKLMGVVAGFLRAPPPPRLGGSLPQANSGRHKNEPWYVHGGPLGLAPRLCHMLEERVAPGNRRLYRLLSEWKANGSAPPLQPEFPRWPSPCV